MVALTQIGLARRAGLSPWKGGGFGMFSTLDTRPHRYLRIRVLGSGRSEDLGVPAWAQALAVVVETLPTDTHFERLGRAVVAHERARGRAADSVHIELWRDEHDAVTLRPTSRKLKEYAWRAPS
jgi:hypothetical protein